MGSRSSRARISITAALLLSGCGGGGGSPASGGDGSEAVVASVDPPRNATGVPRAASVSIQFRKPMDASSLKSGSLVLGVVGVPDPIPSRISVAPSGLSAVVTPVSALAESREHQVRLSSSARLATGRSVGAPWHSEFRTGTGGGSDPTPTPTPTPVPQGSVVAVGLLGMGRSGHAVVAFPDGRVGAFGGFTSTSTVTDTIEVYDPGADDWTSLPATLGVARGRCTGTLLDDGRVFLAGGETESTTTIGTDAWEIFDPSQGAVVSSGTMVERRTNHRAALLPSGKVLIVGGSRTDAAGAPNWSRTTAEVFDPGTLSCAPVGSMAVPRAGHTATVLSDGRVLVAGGHGSIRLAEAYDESSGTFTAVGEMRSARRDHAACPLAGGGVLLTGGGSNSAERWTGSSFLAASNMTDARSLHTMVPVAGGRVFIVGGEKPTSSGGVLFHTITEVFDPGTGQFNLTTLSSSTGRSGHGAARLANGEILVVGGKHPMLGAQAHRTGERFRLP